MHSTVILVTLCVYWQLHSREITYRSMKIKQAVSQCILWCLLGRDGDAGCLVNAHN